METDAIMEPVDWQRLAQRMLPGFQLTMVRSAGIRAPILIAFVALALACNNGVAPAEVAGTYEATTFLLAGDQTGDLIQEGGSLTLILRADGTTSSAVRVPASLSESGTEQSFDLGGTYSLEGDVVRFDQTADTFVRDVDWHVDGATLRSDSTFDGTQVTVILSRQ